jgi:hypothetical protein
MSISFQTASRPIMEAQHGHEDDLTTGEPARVSEGQNSHEDYTEGRGDVRVIITPGAKDIKLAKDGKTVLIPQPSDDPDDVLNWKSGKKLRVLLSLVFASLVNEVGPFRSRIFADR